MRLYYHVRREGLERPKIMKLTEIIPVILSKPEIYGLILIHRFECHNQLLLELRVLSLELLDQLCILNLNLLHQPAASRHLRIMAVQ